MIGSTRTMKAVVTTGIGGYDRLSYRDVPVPALRPGEVLVQVLAAGINNTDINTRLGWYAPAVSGGTGETTPAPKATDGGWRGTTPFPLIQGTDCCGQVVEATDATGEALLGRRVLVRPCMRASDAGLEEVAWMGSDFDGAFAEFVRAPASEVFPVDCRWTDAELATIPCAYGTAENQLERVGLDAGETVLITGASGGTGSASVQLAKRRSARVIAVAGAGKTDAVRAIGADRVIERGDDPVAALGAEPIDVVVDNVGGPAFPSLLKLLRRGGRYVTSGAIAGPQVTLDMRDLYLKDLTLFGSTAWAPGVLPNVIGYIEREEIRPLLAASYPLDRIADAQEAFIAKRHVGNLVLLPPGP